VRVNELNEKEGLVRERREGKWRAYVGGHIRGEGVDI